MRTLCILAVLLFVGIGTRAHADAFVYTYTVTLDPPLYGATFTTKPMQAVIAPNVILTSVDLRSYSLTGSFYLGIFDEFILNYGGGGDQAILTSNGLGTASATLSSNDAFPLFDYSTPGTYSDLDATLVVSRVPEPSTFLLLIIGLAVLIGFLRCRPSAVLGACPKIVQIVTEL